MKQVLQPIDSGATEVVEIPATISGPREVLIANEASLISAGTEKMTHEKTHKISGRDKGHQAELNAFIDAVRRGGSPPIPYGALLNVSWAALAAMESLLTGLPVPV